ncbi:PH domain-containing protein [Litorihabitans aurantiacus]|nr:PH domain-containing protein [Litorihabitans aurantiacus]
MGYPKDTLAADEQLVLHKHPHWKTLVLPFLALVVLTTAAILAWRWSTTADVSDSAATAVGIAVGSLWLVGVLVLFAWPMLRWSTTHFVITDRRVMFRTGILTRTGIDIPMARINTVQFRHHLIDRILRTGTLIIESASDDPLEFSHIPHVERVHSMLYNEVFDTLGDDEAGRR